MSYTYLQERGGESSAESFADIPLFALSKLNHTVGRSCFNASGTESCHDSPSGTTSEPLTENHGEEELTSCAVDSLARILAAPERVQESQENEAGYGRKWHGSFAKFDLNSCLWKTHQLSLLGDWEPFSETWPRWGMMRTGACWELSPLAHLISEIESGSWRTPTVGMLNADRAKDPEYGQRKLAKGQTITLADQVKDSRMWPTPQAHKTTRSGEIVNADGTPWDGIRKPHSKTSGRPITTALADAVAMWGTPRASNGMKDKLRTISIDHDCRVRLEDQVAQMEGAGGYLNPTWVEWLMGWPLGWTDLKPLETARFRRWLHLHGIH